jgi:DNA-binding response OmpR family regulator/nitrogen-specific signal transduction histidine kinase
LELEHIEAENLKEVDNMKSTFFANISHEFRTPLTLIFGPAKDIIGETSESKTKQNAGIIKRNADRLYGLVNQLLDLSKLEAGRMTLETSEQNIIPLLKGLVLSFTSLAERKKITLLFNTIEDNLNAYIDTEKIEKIITNLLSNAFKFTPDGGTIIINVTTTSHNTSPLDKGGKQGGSVEINIRDTGIGIPTERIDKIFDRFYQVDSSHTRESEGTGIGLALTKELVELHKGKIKVESKEGKGTTFTVLLPLGKEHLKPDEIVEKDLKEDAALIFEKTELIPETENRNEKTGIDSLLDTEKPLLLIVEDNSDVRNYIISHLAEDYRIEEAIDGEDGYNKSIEQIPDLIVSDVMMPKMDGFELCEKVKTDERTSHIPIIMLTAKATSKDKIEGYETGADDYIMKPFDAAELKVRIKNLIGIRRKLQKKFSSDGFNIPKELNMMDEQFMKRVLRVINEHISEEEFSIEELGKEAAMSRWQIYKKINALTGKSPSLFLRSVRLVKAKKMIKENKGTISEIAYSVGFSSPAYFSKCFSIEFGFPPSEL